MLDDDAGCLNLKSVYTPTLIDSTVHLPRNVTTQWQHLGSTDRSTCDSPSFCLSQLSGDAHLLLWCLLCYLLSNNFRKRTCGLTFYQLHHQKSMKGLYLPYSYYSVGNEDEEDDKGFDKGCDRSFPFFKPCKCLQRQTGRRQGESYCCIDLQIEKNFPPRVCMKQDRHIWHVGLNTKRNHLT